MQWSLANKLEIGIFLINWACDRYGYPRKRIWYSYLKSKDRNEELPLTYAVCILCINVLLASWCSKWKTELLNENYQGQNTESAIHNMVQIRGNEMKLQTFINCQLCSTQSQIFLNLTELAVGWDDRQYYFPGHILTANLW